MPDRTERAVATAVALAREAGLGGSSPAVLRDAWHVVLHLRPYPIVARVSAAASSPEPDAEGLARELAVVRHAAAAGARVVPPSDLLDPGPHRRDGHVVTFWRFVEPAGDPDPAAAGHGLRTIHDALEDYAGPLPATAHPRALGAMIASLGDTADAAVLRRAAADPPGGAEQALHGDAHLGNCLTDAGGPLWHDFEPACRGPQEYDLAALMFLDTAGGGHPEARTALAGYGEHDAALVDACLPVYGAWVAASMLTALPRQPRLAPVVERRLAWLRSRLDDG